MNIMKVTALIGACFFIAGCAQASAQKQVESKTLSVSQDSKIEKLDKECKSGIQASCKDLGDYFYDKLDFKTAARAYDYTCAKFQYLPACLRLAYMFESGKGMDKNLEIAKDIYIRACHSGDKESCKKTQNIK